MKPGKQVAGLGRLQRIDVHVAVAGRGGLVLPQLAAGFPPRLLAGAVAVSGLYDLRPLVDAEFLKSDLGLDVERAERLSPAFRRPACQSPIVVAVGALESGEFHRQARLLHESWGDACVGAALDVPGTDHFSVCEAFATPGNALFDATCRLLG